MRSDNTELLGAGRDPQLHRPCAEWVTDDTVTVLTTLEAMVACRYHCPLVAACERARQDHYPDKGPIDLVWAGRAYDGAGAELTVTGLINRDRYRPRGAHIRIPAEPAAIEAAVELLNRTTPTGLESEATVHQLRQAAAAKSRRSRAAMGGGLGVRSA
jgi:hypothetical protein